MFYFLLIIGISLIFTGIYMEKDNLSIQINEKHNGPELNELNHLKHRIENIEEILFLNESDLDGGNYISYESVEKSVSNQMNEEPDKLPQNSFERYEKILQYEKEKYSLEEICALLEMKKGEVLLLKNLYKTYKR